MNKFLLSAALIALACSQVSAAEQMPRNVCLWGNQVTQLQRTASGREGFDALLIQRGADFTVASGRPDSEAIESGKPFSVLLPHGEELPSECTLTDAAVRELYHANDAVQVAIDRDVCSDGGDQFMDKPDYTGRNKLRQASDVASYDSIVGVLQVAFAASEQTDSALQAVQGAFCDAVAER